MATRKKIIYVTDPPAGLFYIPDFLSLEEEESILSFVAEQSFAPYDHHGYKANREVVYFGLQNSYATDLDSAQIEKFPDWLLPLRNRFSSLIDLREDELAMALLAQYKAGAGIGWHRDRPQFGPSVLGVSLAADAEMRFRRFIGDIEEMYKINLERRSAYIIGGAARSVWQHGMKPVDQLRYSITFRTIRDKQTDAHDYRHQPLAISERLAELKYEAKNLRETKDVADAKTSSGVIQDFQLKLPF